MKRKELKEKKQNRGITLIALIITIIVLLILAGVTINLTLGENGIFKTAENAGKNYTQAEQEELEGLANFENTINNIIGGTGNSTPVGTGSLTPGKRYDQDTDLTIGDYKITIPGGATISGISGEYENIDKGIVIYIIPENETPDWTAKDENGVYEIQKEYDQFVWVPVKNAILDLSGNATALASDTSIKAAVQSEIDAGRYPMAIKKDATNYIGVLYEFEDATDEEENHYVKVTPYSGWTPTSTNSGTNSGNREPDVVTSYDNNTSYLDQINGILNTSYNNSTSFKTALQTDFNTMVTRVDEKEGFWVGRYETSKMSNSTTTTYAESNKIQVGVKRGTTEGINKVTWYRMYAQQKIYKEKALTESENITSSMIWGSQWDQIMIWMKEVENEAKSSYYVINSLTKGNYGTSDDEDESTAEPAATGNSENYKVKNVFDLAGNVRDWTLEANDTSYRVDRGGYCDGTHTSYTRADNRNDYYPYYSNSYDGSRSTLY